MKRRPGRPSKASSPQLSRERVLQAALAHIDEHGMENVGIRQLAGELGVAPNSLYSYVRDKDDLIHGAVNLAFGELDLPSASHGPWRDRIAELCRWIRSRLLEHPNLVSDPRFAEGAPFPLIPFPTRVGLVLSEVGFEGRELIEMTYAIFYHAVGFVTMEVSRERHGVPLETDQFLVDQIDVENFEVDIREAAADMVPLIRHMNLDSVFERSTQALLRGLSDPPAVPTSE